MGYCHTQGKYSKINKKIELELLYQSLLKLQSENEITLKENLWSQLMAESTKHRTKFKTIISPNLKEAIKTLKNNKDIIIRKADKSNTFVIIDKSEYLDKLSNIVIYLPIFDLITKNGRQTNCALDF